MVTGLLGFTSLEAYYIDLQRLSILGILCRHKATDVTFQLFLLRLYQNTNQCTNLNRGFIPDIQKILKKYSIEHYLEQFILSATFPGKQKWKHICKKTIFESEQQQWSIRIDTNDDCFRFRKLHSQLKPGNVWLNALLYPSSIESMAFLEKLCCLLKSNQIKICETCYTHYNIQCSSASMPNVEPRG